MCFLLTDAPDDTLFIFIIGMQSFLFFLCDLYVYETNKKSTSAIFGAIYIFVPGKFTSNIGPELKEKVTFLKGADYCTAAAQKPVSF